MIPFVKVCQFTLVPAALLAFSLLAVPPSMADAPFGADGDAQYAAELWAALEARGLTGTGPIYSRPYEGTEPHGFVLETLEGQVSERGHKDWAIVKRNYGPAGISVETVSNERDKHLKAVTVMFRREKGFDTDNQDWFWVKYAPGGSVLKNPEGMSLAGRVAKGMAEGCIACHSAAPGGDYLFVTDRIRP